MEIKDFIEETISGIVSASKNLSEKHGSEGVVVNPPTSNDNSDHFRDDERFSYRRVVSVNFDIAVTAAAEHGGGGKIGLKILSAEAGVDGQKKASNEEASRVQFSLPIALPKSEVGSENTRKGETARRSKSSGGIVA